ncbi:MAG: 23S rRNA (pseudouridine(1915)-N(3))-methyltransferase RlmH [Novosphingobium sp.]|nr:23S rRNA (pseudouridine(1915)-N(3))-methyltransferase RlmH [Novosphingobium sp.]
MQLHVVARGKIGRSPEEELVERYARRIAWPLRLTELPERGGSVAAPASPSRQVALDERGRDLTSSEFAAVLSRWRDDGVREARFWVGAADGHEPALRDDADLVMRLGAMTWPHLLVRAMLLEQLWRATSIVAGHPYHREG